MKFAWSVLLILLLPQCFSIGIHHGVYHYYSYNEMVNLLNELKEKHGKIMEYYSIGKTYGGRDIMVIKISDNVSIDENEPEILFTAAHHGNEKPSYQFLLKFIQYLCNEYDKNVTIKHVVDNAEIFFIPMVNPDGVENNTRKNMEPNNCIGENIFFVMRGVNLNRNYDVGWDEWKPWYFTTTTATPYGDVLLSMLGYPPEYRGEKPFSENETKAIKNFVENRHIILAADFHTGAGKIIFYPYGYTNKKPKDEATFISIAENISAINGYAFSEAGKAATGMEMDWLYNKHGVYAIIIEISREIAPQEEYKMEEIVRENIPACMYLINRGIEFMESIPS